MTAPTLARAAAPMPARPRAVTGGRHATTRRRLAASVLRHVIDTAVLVGSRLPPGAAHGLAAAGGTVEWAMRPAKRRRLARNLAHAVSLLPADRRVRRLVCAELRNEARRSADLLWALGRPEAARAATRVEGRRHIEAALARGDGAILAGLHLGGWEIAATVSRDAVPGVTSAVVADDWLAWAMEPRRRAAGLRTIPRGAALAAARSLREGGTLLLLGDDGWGAVPRAHRVRFLDAEAELPAGIAALARLCGSPVVPFTFLPEGPRRWVGSFQEPIGPPARRDGETGERLLLQDLADRWSAAIRSAPEHWAASFPIRWTDAA